MTGEEEVPMGERVLVQPGTTADSRWLIEAGERAEAHLRSLPVKSLGPAARRLLGVESKPCEACGGTGRG